MNPWKCLQLSHHLEIRSGQHTVTADIGVNDGIDAILQKRLDEGQDLLAAAVDPAVGGDGVTVGIDGDGDMVSTVFLSGLDRKVRGGDRFRADDDAPNAVLDMLLDGLLCADAAADFDGNLHRLTDAMDHLGIHAISFESAIKVDDVEIFGPEGFPLERHFHRIIAIDGEILNFALFQTDAVPVFYINCWKYFHFSNHSAKFFQILSPTGPDFSG